MRNFSIDIVWAKIQMAVAAIGGWLGYFLGEMDGLMPMPCASLPVTPGVSRKPN